MQPVAPDTFSTLDEALAEIRRLHDQVDHLQREITRLTAPLAHDATASGETAAFRESPAGRPYVATAPAAAPASATPDNAGAVGQLEQLREAIARLREQRAQVSEEFRNLTRAVPREERAPAAQLPPGPGEPVNLAPTTPSPASTPVHPGTTDATQSAVREMAAAGADVADRFAAGLRPETPSLAPAAAPPPALPEAAEIAPSQRQPPAEAAVRADVAPPTAAADGEPPRAWARRRWLVAAVIVAAAAVAAWFLADRTLRRSVGVTAEPPATQSGQSHPPAAEGGAAVAPPLGATAPAGTPEAAAPTRPGRAGTSAAPPATTAPLRVELEATREVWLRAVVDGRQVTARLVAAGEVLELEANSGVLVRAGDAGAVRLSVNGVDRGRLGRDGAVLTTVFDAATESRKPRR